LSTTEPFFFLSWNYRSRYFAITDQEQWQQLVKETAYHSDTFSNAITLAGFDTSTDYANDIVVVGLSPFRNRERIDRVELLKKKKYG